MSSLTNSEPSQTYLRLIQIGKAGNNGVDGTLTNLQDGGGNNLLIRVSNTSIVLDSDVNVPRFNTAIGLIYDETGNASFDCARGLVDPVGGFALTWDDAGIYGPNWTIGSDGSIVGLTSYDLSSTGPNNGTNGSGLDLSTFNSAIGTVGDGVSEFKCGIALLIDASSRIFLGFLPTSDPGNNFQLWNDSGTLKISAG